MLGGETLDLSEVAANKEEKGEIAGKEERGEAVDMPRC
jgi:hypothetical protein